MHRSEKTTVWNLRRIYLSGKRWAAVFRRDMITVYAAQASFFLLLASVPFLMLLLNVSRQLFRSAGREILSLLEGILPHPLHDAFSALTDELVKTGSIPLLSLSAGAALWSASRGMAALERGLAGVYGVSVSRGLLRDILRSLTYTVLLILLIFSSLLLLVFGAQIADGIMTLFPALERPVTAILGARGMFVFLGLSAFFSLEHRVILKNAPVLPGAVLSAAGWMLFSYLYSLYVQPFPRASYLYGGLSLLVVWMLWLYFCMIIFLVGAEINKMFRRFSQPQNGKNAPPA